MLARPSAYLTLEKPVRKRSRVTFDEAGAGVAGWWDRLADRVLGAGSDALAWRVLAFAGWLIVVLIAYNAGVQTGLRR